MIPFHHGDTGRTGDYDFIPPRRRAQTRDTESHASGGQARRRGPRSPSVFSVTSVVTS